MTATRGVLCSWTVAPPAGPNDEVDEITGSGIDCLASPREHRRTRMSGSFEDDPAIDSMDDARSPRPRTAAFSRLAAEQVVDAIKLLSQREFRVKVIVEDANTGDELWWTRPDTRVRMGDTVHVPIRLEVS